MSDLKFDKRDLDMILDCLDDFQYESCKETCRNPCPDYDAPSDIASVVHDLILAYSQRKEYFIELYMAVNPNQKDYFHCPKCKRILNSSIDWKFESEHKSGHVMIVEGEPGKRKEVFYCKDCGWTGEEAPFEEVKVGGNQAE